MDWMISDTAVVGRRRERDKEPELFVHPQVAAAMIGSAVIGGAISADGAKSAAHTQADAANAATASQRGMFDKTVELNAPFRQSGVDAMTKLNGLLGIGGAAGGATPGMTYDQARAQLLPQFTTSGDRWMDDFINGNGYMVSGQSTVDEAGLQSAIEHLMSTSGASHGVDSSAADYGSLLKPFSMSDFQLDPGIQFQTQQGNQALLNSQAAKNGVLSGGALKDLIAYNQGMAGTGYQSAFDRYMANKGFTLGSLMDMTKVGQSAASGVTSAAPSFSSGIAGTIQGAGNAGAAGQVGAANALSGGLQGASNSYFLNSLLNKGGGDFGGPISTPNSPGGIFIAPSA
jgi:hypothetical protein